MTMIKALVEPKRKMIAILEIEKRKKGKNEREINIENANMNHAEIERKDTVVEMKDMIVRYVELKMIMVKI